MPEAMGWRMRWLPLLLALLVHALAVSALYSGWHPERELVNVVTPRIVNSRLIVMEPKAKPKAAPAPAKPQEKPPVVQRKVEPVAPPKPKPQPQPAVVKKEAIPDPDAIRRKAEEEARRKAEALRQQRLQELASQSFEEALQEEEDAQDAADAEAVADEAAMSYSQGINELVVANWSRPPSARNGMKALLLVELVPTGDLVNVSVVESSGNPAFDRSAEQAVRKARKFEVPKESSLFEARFRRFYLLFQPEDLFR
ncbi:MAG: cell envelope integrity protein TolA [Pseudomonadales bacterium]